MKKLYIHLLALIALFSTAPAMSGSNFGISLSFGSPYYSSSGYCPGYYGSSRYYYHGAPRVYYGGYPSYYYGPSFPTINLHYKKKYKSKKRYYRSYKPYKHYRGYKHRHKRAYKHRHYNDKRYIGVHRNKRLSH